MTALADYQARLIEQLAMVNEKLEALSAQRYLLEHEKQRLEYKLRGTEHRPLRCPYG
jgi:hypothetical protein